ncbi:MAG: HEAT repeat domain-containing protein [Planctomycetes bacterium]|nr:HEAT repeat domain-containing protein [Planctomycetota bacterium]
MRRLLAATCLFLGPVPLPPVAHGALDPHVDPARGAAATLRPTAPGDEKAIKALEAWLKLYRAGKVDYTSKANIAKESVAAKYGITPKEILGAPTWAGDLELILEAVARQDDAAAAQALLEVAAIGLDQGKYTREMSPVEVRAAGERWAAKLRTPAAKEEFCRAARGERKVDKARAAAFRAAAARCLGLLDDRTLAGALEPLLRDEEELVRATAAEAFGKLADERSIDTLVEFVGRETGDAALQLAAQALQAHFARRAKPSLLTPGAPAADGADGAPAAAPPLPPELRRAVVACSEALGRATWRADMALVRFLDEFRAAEAVPALIGVLERFRNRPEDVRSGRLSGLLQFQVHELLAGMTGAVIPADQPEKWRQLWESRQGNLVVAEKRATAAGGATAADGFCGIPIQGTRVLFVLDLSGSMDWPMRGREQGTSRKRAASGIDFAKQELHRAMTAIAPNAQFNLITFNGDPKPEIWSKDLVVATDKNKERFLKFVDGLKARGGTNLWGALEESLAIRSLVQGTRYDCNVDEIFILSDGAPSVGAVVDPIEILRLVKETNRFASVRINTVFVNTEPPPEMRQPAGAAAVTPAELMRRLAEQNGGKFEEL